MLNVAHAAEVTAAATTQARTEKTVSLTAQDFTAYAPSETFQNYVNWTLKTDKLAKRSDATRTVYTVDVAKLLEGINIDKSSLKIGLGATPGTSLAGLEKGGDFPFPMYVKDEAAEPRQGALPYGATTITANADGTITIPRNDDSRQTISFLYSVKDANGDLITQRITIAPTLPKVAPGAVNASTTIGELGTTNGNPTTVKAGANGEVTFTYTNNSEITATTAARQEALNTLTEVVEPPKTKGKSNPVKRHAKNEYLLACAIRNLALTRDTLLDPVEHWYSEIVQALKKI